MSATLAERDAILGALRTGAFQPQGDEQPIHLAWPDNRIVLVEGIFDALRVRRAWPGLETLALLGSTISEQQVRLVYDLQPSLVIVMLDADAQEKAKAAAAMVGLVAPVRRAVLRDGKDPDEAPINDLRDALSGAGAL